MRFERDRLKDEENRTKHGVSFEDAQSIFFDEAAREFFDPDHSHGEDRFLLVGRSYSLRILLICHCFRESDCVVRLISARRATKSERAIYQGGRG